ncbi:hypothetical protein ACW69C_21420 [Streptomyces sp. MN3]|uniref:hypothetical protein n=1 Tax=Streptomyces sp. yara TaxID=3458421 RepID=UPI00403FD9AB
MLRPGRVQDVAQHPQQPLVVPNIDGDLFAVHADSVLRHVSSRGVQRTTGDLGTVDARGVVTVNGRKKELTITHAGSRAN